jgi:XTP/dITP diphosphohydrolase
MAERPAAGQEPAPLNEPATGPETVGQPVAGARLLELVAVMDRLRRDCPWDARQTHDSLAPFLLEETYEALEALEGGDSAAIREELGDVLLQVVFHARVAAERTDGTGYTIDDVAGGIIAKLTRRHPHVFADVTVSGAQEVTANWDAIKAAERSASGGAPGSALDGVPMGQPALSLATALQRRAERAGAPAELADLAAPATGTEPAAPAGPATGTGPADPGDPARSPEGVSETGAELFALAARARAAGLDPELELRSAARAYRDRVRAWEAAAGAGPGPSPGS